MRRRLASVVLTTSACRPRWISHSRMPPSPSRDSPSQTRFQGGSLEQTKGTKTTSSRGSLETEGTLSLSRGTLGHMSQTPPALLWQERKAELEPNGGSNVAETCRHARRTPSFVVDTYPSYPGRCLLMQVLKPQRHTRLARCIWGEPLLLLLISMYVHLPAHVGHASASSWACHSCSSTPEQFGEASMVVSRSLPALPIPVLYV